MSAWRELARGSRCRRRSRPTRRRSSRPGARAHGGALRAGSPPLHPVEHAGQVLDVVAVLVREHVRLRERPALRAEPRLEVVEEAEIDVDALVRRAVERPDLARRRRRSRSTLAVEEGRRPPAGTRGRGAELAVPVRLDAVDEADDAAVLAAFASAPVLALLRAPRSGAAPGSTGTPTRSSRRAAATAAEHADEQVDDEHRDAEPAAADRRPARRIRRPPRDIRAPARVEPGALWRNTATAAVIRSVASCQDRASQAISAPRREWRRRRRRPSLDARTGSSGSASSDVRPAACARGRCCTCQMWQSSCVTRSSDAPRARLQQDRAPERVAVVAPHVRQPEEPGRHDDAHAVEAHRPRVEVEPVEPRPFARSSAASARDARGSAATQPSPATAIRYMHRVGRPAVAGAVDVRVPSGGRRWPLGRRHPAGRRRPGAGSVRASGPPSSAAKCPLREEERAGCCCRPRVVGSPASAAARRSRSRRRRRT